MTTSSPEIEEPLQNASALGPSTAAERIVAIDVLRGFALLGILLINIRSFANIEAAYFNPLAAGPLSRLDLAVWWTTELLGESKFMTLFSMLFGAGVVLMYERRCRARLPTARIHYRRMLGLLAIGLILVISSVYLKHFRLGPVEAAWRTLTYWRWPGGWPDTAGSAVAVPPPAQHPN